ncbi:MAG: hypothetical protein IH877_10140 [Gemmatimonadetes bacterium]|nr:hypothetical protein [Gemmatimonadota bacterium]
MDYTTKIAGRDVLLEAGEVITLQFSAGRGGKLEAGAWEFWTVFNDGSRSTARCRPGSDPGERFRRMEGSPGYETHWEIAATSKGVRPATQNEVIEWLNAHLEDAKFAEYCQIGSKNMRVVETANGFRFE